MKDVYEGMKDRLNKIEEVQKAFKICKEGSPVIAIKECWEEAGYLYICSELCELGNLNDFLFKKSYNNEIEKVEEHLGLKRRSSLKVRTSLTPLLAETKIWDIFADMARCVAHVNDSNFVHMDIKPRNFLVDANQKVKLGDFGIAIDLLKIS